MNLRKIIPTLALSAMLLASCGVKEVSYADFNAAAKEAPAHSYTAADVYYESKTESSQSTATAKLKFGADVAVISIKVWVAESGDATLGTAAALLANAPASSVGENADYKYYLDGKNFKVQLSESSYNYYESHGLLIEAVTATTKTTISYK